MVGKQLLDRFKQNVQRRLPGVVFAVLDPARPDQLHDVGEILFLLGAEVDQEVHQRGKQHLAGFVPEGILRMGTRGGRRLVDGGHNPLHVVVRLDICKRIVPPGMRRVFEVEHLDGVAALFLQDLGGVPANLAGRVEHDIVRGHFQQVRIDIAGRFAGTRAADDQGVEVSLVRAQVFPGKADGKVAADCYAMEMIEGKSALFALGMLFMSKKRRLAFADEITSALHSVHMCTSDKFGDTMHPDCDSWTDFYRPFAEAVLAQAEKMFAEGQLPLKVISAMRAAWAKFGIIFSENVKVACLIHGDLNVGNIMVGKRYKITGIIDPLNSMYADREYDLFQFNNLTGKRFFLCETYVRRYGASELCAHKLAFYGLWNEVYCTIRSGVLVNLIMKPLVKNMRAQLEGL